MAEPTDSPIQHLVLYGSLRSDAPGFRRQGLDRALQFVRKVSFCGTLYDLGAYPGAVLAGRGRVVGELFRILDAGVVGRLDAFEGYDPADPRPYREEDGSGSLYLRQVLDVGPGPLKAYVYGYNGQTRAGRLRRFPAIPGGDWLRHGRSAA